MFQGLDLSRFFPLRPSPETSATNTQCIAAATEASSTLGHRQYSQDYRLRYRSGIDAVRHQFGGHGNDEGCAHNLFARLAV